MTTSSTGVLVLGMHRSGTSAFTKVLNLMGADLGSRLKDAGPDNPLGFWEHEAIIDLHETLLAALGRTWDDLRPLPDGWQHTSAARDAMVAAATVITRDFAACPLWAVKDPRLCRFVPLWRSVMSELDIESRAVIVYREPLEVAHSLQARNRLPAAAGQFLWARYMGEAEAGSRGMMRSLVSYSELLRRWEAVMGRVERELKIPLAVSEDIRAQIDDFLRPSLRHHVDEGKKDLPAVIGRFAEAYRRAIQERDALDGVALATREFDETYQPVIEVVDGLSQQLLQERRDGADRFRELEVTAAALAEATEWGTSRDQELRDTLDRVQTLQRELAESTEWGASRDQDLRHALERTESLREELRASTQWGASRDREVQIMVARAKELEAERASLEQEIEHLNDRFAAELRTLTARLDDADLFLARKQQEVDGLQSQANELNARLSLLEHHVQQGLRHRFARLARHAVAAAKRRAKILVIKVAHSWPGSPEARQGRVARLREIHQVYRNGLNGRAIRDDLHMLARRRWPALPVYQIRTGGAVEFPALDISVVVYESERWVPAFMESLVAIDYPLDRIRLHVRDHSLGDGSQRAFEAFFKHAGDALGGYSYTRGGNRGFGAGHNHNFGQSQADYFLVTNIDGRFHASSLKNLIRAVATSAADVAAWELRQVPYEHPKYYDPVTMLTTWVSGACVLFRRSAFQAVGGFDDAIFMYGEDVDVSYRLRAAGHALAYVPHAVFHHDSYIEPEQFKPLQFHGSSLANALLRLRFGRFADIAVIPSMWLELHTSAIQLGQVKGYWHNLREFLKLAPRFLLTRPPKGRVSVPFARWDYGLRRDGAFELIDGNVGPAPLVSIVVRTYRGREALLRQALASIANQTYRNVEAVVVEDRGDTLAGAVAAIANEFGLRVAYHACLEPESNRCFTGNRGLEVAQGAYLNFLDDDDLLFADHVEYLVSRMQAHPEAAACYALSWEAKVVPDPVEPGLQWEVMHSTWPGHKREFDRNILAEFNFMPIQAVMFRRELYERFGGMDLRLENLEDWELWRRYSLERDFRYCPKTTSIYHVPGDLGVHKQRQALLDEYLPIACRVAEEARARFAPQDARP